ncbi:MAG: cytochrome P450 [Pseudomonadota bacterium]
MPDSQADILADARAEAAAAPLEGLDPSDPARFEAGTHWPWFDRLRREAPVHFTPDSPFGPYWSVTRWDDIMTVETDPATYSSKPTIMIGDPDPELKSRSFITSDAPLHGIWRKPAMPAVGPERLDALEAVIRTRAGELLDGLPRGETFDWVERVSVDLTATLLATLFDVPREDRGKLIEWSEATTATPSAGGSMSFEARREILMECLAYFTALWERRAQGAPAFDFISLYAQHPDTADMAPLDLLGNVMLLIVGGNDTTRNSISGGLLALNDWPDEYAKLRADPGLIPNMVKEIVRW